MQDLMQTKMKNDFFSNNQKLKNLFWGGVGAFYDTSRETLLTGIGLI